MKPLRKPLPIAIVALLLGAVASAGDLVVGHVSIRLGMPQTQALSALGKEFDVKQVSGSEGKYLLWTREPETKATYSAGSVSFRDGKLYRASKTWATAGVKNMNEAAEGLFGALGSVGCQAGKPCRVKAETLRTPASIPNGEDVELVTIEAPPDRSVFVKIRKPHAGGGPMPFSQWEIEEYLAVPASP